MIPKAALVAFAALAHAPSSTDAFVPSWQAPAFLRNNANDSSSALSMGKSMTMPGPSSGGKSGPAASEYRQKKMSKRLKGGKKKKKGGFSDDGDDDDADGISAGKGRPMMEIELVAEPEGGTEVSRLPATGGDDAGEGEFVIRLKDLGPVDASDPAYDLKDSLGTEVHNFWLTALADGQAIEKTRTVVLKESAKNANFPGFRKGQIPPYAQPKMTNFALQDVLITSCQEAIKMFGVNEINEGQLGAVTFNEKVEDISKKYNIKKFPSVPFTANFRATFDPDAVRETSAASVDAEGKVDEGTPEDEA